MAETHASPKLSREWLRGRVSRCRSRVSNETGLEVTVSPIGTILSRRRVCARLAQALFTGEHHEFGPPPAIHDIAINI